MNPPDLKQARGFHKVELTLQRESILVFEKNLLGSRKTYVRYEAIPPRPVEITVNHKKVLVAALFFSIIAILFMFFCVSEDGKTNWEGLVVWSLVAAIFWFFFFLSRRSIVRFVRDGEGLNLYKDRPTPQKFEDFLEKLFMFRKDFLVKKYGKFLDEEDYAAKMHRLISLRDNEAITEEEFDRWHKEFAAGKKPPGPLGFAPQ